MLAIETASQEKIRERPEKDKAFFGFIWHFVHFLSSTRFPNINFNILLVMRQLSCLLDNRKPPG
ncbi:MAG: hypothetical protein OSB74_10420 [Verrucomicrobiota bacterium]|nr:hypothetical protein [Verrucomicrobiota bacterium]